MKVRVYGPLQIRKTRSSSRLAKGLITYRDYDNYDYNGRIILGLKLPVYFLEMHHLIFIYETREKVGLAKIKKIHLTGDRALYNNCATVLFVHVSEIFWVKVKLLRTKYFSALQRPINSAL